MPVPNRGKYKNRWVGSSRNAHPVTIEAAIADAYNLAKPSYKGKKQIDLRVADIYVRGNNPITEYLVVLVPGT
jgi:hypothetical protein